MIINYKKTNYINLYKIIDKNNLIGIGEEAHGELTSWMEMIDKYPDKPWNWKWEISRHTFVKDY